MDPGLNNLLKWSIQNSDNKNAPTTEEAARSGLNAEALRALMGGPSDADLMRESMAVIVNPEADMEARLIAFDNFEQLVEGIDNANNIAPLGLWTPLIGLLDNAEADIRRMAAWCIGTAVQNNTKAQERLLAVNGIPILCQMATEDTNQAARRKGVYALSSAVRNYQPALTEAIRLLPASIVGSTEITAEDMDAIDAMMQRMRELK